LGETIDESLDDAHFSLPAFCKRERLQTSTFDATQVKVTGRLGEFLACKYFKVGKTRLPYDLVIGGR